MNDLNLIDDLVASVLSGAKYRSIDPELVRRIGLQELTNRRSYKEALKATHSRLHQIGAAFQETKIDYPHWTKELGSLSDDPENPSVQLLCRQAMNQHASTRERLPILESFYQRIFGELEPVHSVLDLACGLNPLALSWMSLAPQARYYACDIYADMVVFLNLFFNHIHQPGQAFIADLTYSVPNQAVDLALFLKTIPCLEQVDKTAGLRVLETVSARQILVSFPVHSLGGRSKGMVKNYEAHFNQLIAGHAWGVRRFEFSTELAFLITKE